MDKETRVFDGRDCVLQIALTADFALLRADRGDRWGNLTYRGTQANFGPAMAAAAKVTIAEVRQVVADGEIDPHHVRTPGIYVDRMITVPEES